MSGLSYKKKKGGRQTGDPLRHPVNPMFNQRIVGRTVVG
jgi:hypothetical protein